MAMRRRSAGTGATTVLEEEEKPKEEKEDQPPGSHSVLQQRLRSVSQEADELAKYVEQLNQGNQAAQTLPAAPAIAEAHAEGQGIGAKVKHLHDDLESWGYHNFPVITDHFNFLVYGVDLAVHSIRWFQFGFAACWLGFRLFIYSIMLLPAFVSIMLTYYHDPRIKRRIRYGPAEREYLDIYVPEGAEDKDGKRVPVVVAIMGGAFIIGHRGYNAQLGLRMMDFGIMTVGVDYRNFPRGCIPDMVEDVGRGVRWVFDNIKRYGGDTSNVMLLGQSAGAHLAAMLVLEHGLLEARSQKQGTSFDHWSVKDLKAFLGVSGPYHLEKLGPHLSSRGLYPGIMDHMTAHDLNGCSPEALLDTEEWQEYGREKASELLPCMHLFHGDRDKAVPSWSSEHFADALKRNGLVEGKGFILDVRKGMTHTYPVVEGPMRRHDPQVELVLPMLFGPGAEKRILEEKKRPPMANERILELAGIVSPF